MYIAYSTHHAITTVVVVTGAWRIREDVVKRISGAARKTCLKPFIYYQKNDPEVIPSTNSFVLPPLPKRWVQQFF